MQDESPRSEALQTEAADARNADAVLADAVLADGGTLDLMQLDPACGSVQANPAVTARGTTTDDHPDRSQLPHAAAAVESVKSINPVESVPEQVGTDVTLSPFLSANLPPDNHRLSHCFVSYQH